MANAQFNKVFKEANETKKRYRVLMGSAGSGKSVNVAQDYIVKLSNPQNKGCSLLVVRASEASHLNSTFAELYGAIMRLGLESLWTVRANPMQMINIVTGNYILFRGCNDLRALERLKSVTVPNGKLCWIWVEEATELKATDFELLNDRLRGQLDKGLYYQITCTFNPVNAAHWIKARLWDYDDKNTFRHKSTFLDNRFIDKEYRERMERRKVLDPEGYKVYGLGEWGETGGVILTNFEVCDLADMDFNNMTLGVDFGFNHASVCLLVAHRDEDVYILQEIYAKEKTNAEFIGLLGRGYISRNTLMYCDSAEPDRIKELKQVGYRAYPVKKEPNSVRQQIEFLRQRKIYIDGSCSNTIREIQAYRYKKDHTTGECIDEPLELDDDCIAALRYSIEPYRRNRKLIVFEKRALGL